MKNTKLLFLLPLLAFLGCSQNANHNTYSILQPKLKLLEGRWTEMHQKNYIETWAFNQGDTLLTGAGFSVGSGVLKRTEKLAIVKNDTSIFYQATVEGQNQGATISFKLMNMSGSTLVFENPDHDFPQQIIYNFLNDSTISVKVGSIADTSNNFILMMRKEKLHQKLR